MSAFAVAKAGAAASAMLVRAGVLRPLAPRPAMLALGIAFRHGASPSTAVGLSALRFPDRTAIIDDAGRVTYQELQDASQKLAAHLVNAHQVGPGTEVALMCRNHRGLASALLAVSGLGADVLLLNTELPASQLSATLERHAPALVLHDDEFSDALSTAAPALTRLLTWENEAPTQFAGPARLRRNKPGKIVLLTSGTTGAPKGVPRELHASALLGTIATVLHRMDLRTKQTMLVAPPVFHGMGLITLLLGLSMGNTVVLHRRFDASTVVDAIEEHHVTTLVAVPTMLQRLLRVPGVKDRTQSLRVVLSGAAALSPVVAHEVMDQLGDVLFDGYGSSEVGIVTIATPRDLRTAPGTLGRPTLGTSIRIIDPDGQILPPSEVGEVFVSSAMTFDGYTGGGHKNVRDGHVSTGDLGHLDSQGRLFIDGRADDMIVSGGENVFPQPVEDALLSHPSIADAAVVGVPDPEFGQRLRAYVVLAETDLDEGDLRAHLRTRLTRYEQPRDIVVMAELPRNATGKLLRKQLSAGPTA